MEVKKTLRIESHVAAGALPALSQCEIQGEAEAEFHLWIVW